MKRTRGRITVLALFLALLGGSFAGAGSGSLAQQASPSLPSHIHSGDCDELGPIIQPLNSLTVPPGKVLGNGDAVVAEAAFTSIPQPLDELLAEDKAIKIHLSKDQIQVYLACGDIGGALDADGALIVGLKEVDNSGYAGIAYLVPAADGGTSVSVMIAKVLPGGGPKKGQAAATAEGTSGAQAGAAAAGPNVVGVALTEFAINMPATIPAGPTRFNISNVGTVAHSFVIEGEGVSEQLADTLPPRQTASLDLDLKPGTYTIYCPVGDGAHRSKGMEATLTVT
jgi:plastocyanin